MAGALFLAFAVIFVPHPIAFLLAVGIHELAHVVTARLFGWGRVWRVSAFTGFGICYCGVHSAVSRLCVSLSGCAAGFILYLIPFLDRDLRLYSLGLSCFNLLPMRGLDGGEAFLCIAEVLLSPRWAWTAFRLVSVAAVLWLCGFCIAIQLKAGPNMTLLAVTLFLILRVLETDESSYRKG